MALDPEISQKMDQIVQQFDEVPFLTRYDTYDVFAANGHGHRVLWEACYSDDRGIDSMEQSLMDWYNNVYLDKFYRDPSFREDVLMKLVLELKILR